MTTVRTMYHAEFNLLESVSYDVSYFEKKNNHRQELNQASIKRETVSDSWWRTRLQRCSCFLVIGFTLGSQRRMCPFVCSDPLSFRSCIEV